MHLCVGEKRESGKKNRPEKNRFDSLCGQGLPQETCLPLTDQQAGSGTVLSSSSRGFLPLRVRALSPPILSTSKARPSSLLLVRENRQSVVSNGSGVCFFRPSCETGKTEKEGEGRGGERLNAAQEVESWG